MCALKLADDATRREAALPDAEENKLPSSKGVLWRSCGLRGKRKEKRGDEGGEEGKGR